MDKYFIIASAVVSICMCVYSLVIILKNYKESKNRANRAKHEAIMSLQREELERRLYLERQHYLNNIDRFRDVNNLFIASQDGLQINSAVRNDSFFQDLGINMSSIRVKHLTAMCIMPFHSMFNKTYTMIEKACEDFKIDCYRSDKEFIPTTILQHIVTLIAQSEIIIAVIDGQNANVTYELGIAHALGKPVILVADIQNFKKIPTDILPQNILLYRSYDELYVKLCNTFQNIYMQQESLSQPDIKSNKN